MNMIFHVICLLLLSAKFFVRQSSADEDDLCIEFGKAANDGDLDKVRQMFQKGGFDINCQDENNYFDDCPTVRNANALIRALQCCRGQVIEILHFLLDNGINVNAQEDSGGYDGLMLSAFHGRIDIAQILLDRGANVNAKSKLDHETALMLASWYNQPEMCRFLLKNGAKVNDQEAYGYTPLIWAAYMNHLEIVQIMLDAGAYVDTPGPNDGDTALILAAYSAKVEIVKLLVERGAAINAASRVGDTALMGAAWNGKMQTVRFLVEHGAAVNAVNARQLTPLKFAQMRNHTSIIKYLKEHGALE